MHPSGELVGDPAGLPVGELVGASVGLIVGELVGVSVGELVGSAVTAMVGEEVGLPVGTAVESSNVGALVGEPVGIAVVTEESCDGVVTQKLFPTTVPPGAKIVSVELPSKNLTPLSIPPNVLKSKQSFLSCVKGPMAKPVLEFTLEEMIILLLVTSLNENHKILHDTKTYGQR